MTLLMVRAARLTDKMLSERFQTVLLLVFLVFSLACATENAKEEEPPPCSEPLKTQTSSSDDDDDNDDGGDGYGLPPQEERPCIPPLEFEPTEEEQPTEDEQPADEDEPADEGESTDEAQPTQLSLDQDDDDGTNVTALVGKCTSSVPSKRRQNNSWRPFVKQFAQCYGTIVLPVLSVKRWCIAAKRLYESRCYLVRR